MNNGNKSGESKIQRTHIEIILDESGSMGSTVDATISGINEYLDTFRTKRGVTLHITKFDDVIREVANSQEISTFPRLSRENYQPNANTALLDAIGKTLNHLRNLYAKNVKILVIIMTDGYENASREYSRTRVAEMIREVQELGNYTIVYLGANQDAWAVGSQMNTSHLNTQTYNQNNFQGMTRGLAAATANYMANPDMSSEVFLGGYDLNTEEDTDDKYRNTDLDGDT